MAKQNDFVTYVCPRCGGGVGATANTYWDVETQSWEAGGTHDEFWCTGTGDQEGCGWEGDPTERPLTKAEFLALPLSVRQPHGQHRKFKRSDWELEVSEHNVQSGYWDWVDSQKEQEQ